jgi:hypothetical protein
MADEQQELLDEQERLNRFWAFQKKELERRIQHPELADYAFKILADEQKRQVPVSNMKSLESALADGEEAARILLPMSRRINAQEIGALGGRARRPDPLNELIGSIVQKRPGITHLELLEVFKAQAPDNVVVDVSVQFISYVDARGKLTDTPVSGLKDRLSRVRKQLAKKAH